MRMRWGLPVLAAVAGLTGCRRVAAPVASSAPRAGVALVAGVGNARFAMGTGDARARAFFDQGLNYYFAFNFEQAKRSFGRAAELDSKAAMPWWGLAMAAGPNYNDTQPGVERRKEAVAALAKAAALAASPATAGRERDYVAALAARYGGAPDYALEGEKYAAAMGALHAKYPEDEEAATLYAEAMMVNNAWNLWSKAGAPRATTPAIVATLEGVLARDPDNVGANHLLIHAVEASRNPDQALASAGRLPGLAPAAGHLVHMPSHVYQRDGNFAGSARANEEAIAVDDAYYRSLGNPPAGTRGYDSYRVHNKYFLVAGCNMEGNDGCSQKAAAALAAYVRPAVRAGKMNEWFLVQQPWMLVRFGHWGEILNAPAPPGGTSRALAGMWLYGRASALAATGRVAEARVAAAKLERAGRTLPKAMAGDMGTGAGPIFRLAGLVVRARIEEAAGDRAGALAKWREAVALQDEFGYSEPPDWYYPVRESLGGALLRDGQARAAEAVFRRDLGLNAGNGRSLFGLWQALVGEHRDAEAGRARAVFEAAWRGADTQLSVAGL